MQSKPTNTKAPTRAQVQALDPGTGYQWTEYNYTLSIHNTEARTYTGPNGRIVGQSFGYYLTARSPQARRRRWSLGDLLYRGQDIDALFQALALWYAQQQAKINARKKRADEKRAARQVFVNPYKPGQVLYSSWGYDQTNCEFYEILEVRPTTLVIRQVAQARDRYSHDAGHCTPTPGRYVDEPKVARIQVNARGSHHIPSPDHPQVSNLYLWDGQPLYYSDGH